MQNMKAVSLHDHHEPASKAQSHGSLEHDVKPSQDIEAAKSSQHVLADVPSSFPPETKVASPNAQAWQRCSPGLATKANPPSEQYMHEQGMPVMRGEETREECGIPHQKTFGHTRAPSTNSPTTHPLLGLDDARRRRSQSIGSTLRDPRIAALSVQLRSRLSYAAAKVEKKRQSHASNPLLHHRSSTPILSAEGLFKEGHSLSIGDIEGQRSAANGSPNGTTVSAPDVPVASNVYPLEVPARSSPVSIADDMYPPSQVDPPKHSSVSTSVDSAPLRLAPPADIVSGRVSGQRRRPNPNISMNNSRYSPFPLHRRHHSQQEIRVESDVVMVPETPPLRPLGHHALAPYNGLTETSQSSSMEQDAIETLIFMSSPGTSGYHLSSQSSQNTLDTTAIDSAWRDLQTPGGPGDSQACSGYPAQADNNAARAGDEIDLMLDQMDSDSDEDVNYSSRSARVRTGPVVGAMAGNSSLPGT
ncbi:hypothetical protein BJX63DRAFT_293962 [Aspergillus granulosus]|uniref:Uncharacterized protein n=1 Tax=Aspergillus granulosus TaxID=176169 RepID=A0ABR4H6D8_9EURO